MSVTHEELVEALPSWTVAKSTLEGHTDRKYLVPPGGDRINGLVVSIGAYDALAGRVVVYDPIDGPVFDTTNDLLVYLQSKGLTP